MSSARIHTALNFPTATSHPSLTCLQWSAEGQLFFATKNVVYILTPEYGITYDNVSAIKSGLKKKNASEQATVGWFRTIVQLDAAEACKWPEYSQDWGAVSLGSIDSGLWSVAISPSNMSSTSGCIIATLSSNLDFCLWSAARNSLKGEWAKIYDVTPYLFEKFQRTRPDDSQMVHTLRAQVVSICWTQADFAITPVPRCNGSLLVAGNRAGSITLLRSVRNSLHFVKDIPLCDHWITNFAFSALNGTEPGTASGILAYGTSSGAVGAITITQRLIERTDSSLFSPEYDIEVAIQDLGVLYQSEKAGITSMRWIVIPTRPAVLVFSKPGRLIFWSSAEDAGWSGLRTLTLRTQKVHKSSSALHPVTGVSYIAHKDILIVTLADGSFHVVQRLSSNPSWSEDSITSQQLTKTARSVFIETQYHDIDSVDMNRITGAASFDDAFNLVWSQEAMRPSDFSYKHEAKHNSTLVVAELWEDEENADDLLLENLKITLRSVKASSGRGPLDLLRPFLFCLNDKTKLNELHPRILQILLTPFDGHSPVINIPPCKIPLSDEVRRQFRESLSRHLFGYDALVSLRMQLALADFIWKHSDTEEKRTECGLVAQKLLNEISHRSLRAIIRHLGAIVDLLQPEDIPFVLRIVIQSLMPDSPPDLFAEAERLSQQVRARIQAQGFEAHGTDEYCPACNVPLQVITNAVCTNGHQWTRCSITTFILPTPYVRTCIGCSRKAFLPLSARMSPDQPNWLPLVARGWVVEELLEAVQRCLFCNNSFVRVL